MKFFLRMTNQNGPFSAPVKRQIWEARGWGWGTNTALNKRTLFSFTSILLLCEWGLCICTADLQRSLQNMIIFITIKHLKSIIC